MTFGQQLIGWYQNNKRDLPWRQTNDPYKIWLSEIILQQTRVAQGLPYYTKFISLFPTVFDLAQASEEQVLLAWQGLGYYSRARNLHYTARYISENHNGVFPKTYTELLKLKGVGSYTAAAIASFSYQEPVAVLDGNVYRVLSRYFGIETDISSGGAKKEFELLANQVLEKKYPSLFNQAIMEFGALQCVPRNPNCRACLLNDSCWALKENKVELLPIKLKKTKVSRRYLNYLIFIDPQEKTLINKRTQNGIWKNLYEFPCLELEKAQSHEIITQKIKELYTDKLSINQIVLVEEKETIHKLSHQDLRIHFWRIEIQNNLKNGIPLHKLPQHPFPIVLFNFIKSNLPDY